MAVVVSAWDVRRRVRKCDCRTRLSADADLGALESQNLGTR